MSLLPVCLLYAQVLKPLSVNGAHETPCVAFLIQLAINH